ncbi:MAG: sterol desaturase family protein [Polyangiales bacterium]
MVDTLTRSLVFVGLVALAFVPLERAFPIREEGARRGLATDLAFATFGRVATKLLLVFGVGRLLDVADAHAWENGPWNAVESVSARTLVTVGLGLLLFELGGYAYHRLAHRVPFLWRLHEVHHSAETMDWLASYRQHPLEIALMTLAQNLPLVALGIPLASHAAVLVLLELNTVFVHSNVRIPEGPWSEIFATPRFHHRHHDRLREARNFATLFPFLDRLFGTHVHERSDDFGLPERRERGFVAWVVRPFRASRARPSVPPA